MPSTHTPPRVKTSRSIPSRTLEGGEVRTLEMLAVAMSEEYNVNVVCNGQSATSSFSEKSGRTTITIPSIPLTDRHYRALLRGYVDHEVGHVRFTDREIMSSGPLRFPHIAGALRNIGQILEDVYVERSMGESFPGCRRNLRLFVMLLYVAHDSALLPPPPAPVDAAALLEGIRTGHLSPTEVPYRLWTAISLYILFRIRGAALPKIADRLTQFRAPLDLLTPGLTDRLERILARVQDEGTNSEANLHLTREIVEEVLAYFEQGDAPLPFVFTPAMLDTLKWVLRNGGSSQESVDAARLAELFVHDLMRDIDPRLLENQVSIHDKVGSDLWQKRLLPLSEEEQLAALQASAKMDAQMQALLQSFELNRAGPFRHGRLDTNALHKLFTCRNDIFFRHLDRRAINTEIALCVDMSGSMRFDDKALLASKALYSLAHCLAKIRGLSFSISGFFDNHVVDVVRRDSRISPRMRKIGRAHV